MERDKIPKEAEENPEQVVAIIMAIFGKLMYEEGIIIEEA